MNVLSSSVTGNGTNLVSSENWCARGYISKLLNDHASHLVHIHCKNYTIIITEPPVIAYSVVYLIDNKTISFNELLG